MKLQKKFRVSLAYNQWPDSIVDEFTGHTVSCMTGNAAFPLPPVALTDVTTLQAAFESAMDDAADGGTQLTAVKNQAREAVQDALDQNASYVQGIASHDLAVLLSSGYQAASKNRAKTPLPAPVIMAILNEQSGQLVVRLNSIANAYAYEVQISTAPGVWKSVGAFTQARRIVLTGLISGTVYTMQARAIGGSTGYSDWSDPVSHIVT